MHTVPTCMLTPIFVTMEVSIHLVFLRMLAGRCGVSPIAAAKPRARQRLFEAEGGCDPTPHIIGDL